VSGRGEQHQPRQLGLFGALQPPADEPPKGGPPATSSASSSGRPLKTPSVDPAQVDAAAQALAGALPAGLRLGTSSWAFAGWRGAVYAPDAPERHLSRYGLSAYAQHPLLRAVGLDRTFYAPLAAAAFGDYAAQVPEDFRFLVKAWQELTSPTLRGRTGLNPNYLDAACAIDRCVAPAVEGLGGKLGPLLLQFPPQGGDVTRRPEAFADRLHGFLDALPRGPRYVVELRDERLLTDRYRAALQATGAQHGYVAHPRMPSIARQRELAPPRGPTTARWMLRQGLHYQQAKERYAPFDALTDPDPQTRGAITELVADSALRDVEAVVIVNNKAEGSSPLSVLELARAIVQASADENARSTSGS